MPDFALLAPVMQKLHGEFVKIYFMMLPGFFVLAICVQWFKSSGGVVDFIDILRRAVLSTLLLIAFPEISQAIVAITDGIAHKIDRVDSLDTIMNMAAQKAESYSFSAKDILLMFDDLVIAILTFISYLVLLVARYFMVAMYNFFWLLLMVISPLILLFNLFKGTSQITVNLFRSMIEVASWKIVWAILGAMLTSLSFGDMYMMEGHYTTQLIMNFVIALAMLGTPAIVRSLVGNGIQQASNVVAPTALLASAFLAAKGVTFLQKAGPVIAKNASGKKRRST